jgi:hypothetical protein
MIWDGETVFTTWGYQPLTRPALEWVQDSAGYWSASDRGSSQDVLEAAISFRGPQEELETLEAVLEDNREGLPITCGLGEEIFGADVDYTGALSVTVIDYGEITRVTFSQYAMPLRLRLLAPTFKATSPSFAALRLSGWRYGAFSTFEIGKAFSYSGTPIYADRRDDVGVFKGEFTQTQSEMEAIRRYLLTTARGNAITFPTLGGITHPFGNRKPAIGAGLYCHVLEWEDLGRANLMDWGLSIVFAEAEAP